MEVEFSTYSLTSSLNSVNQRLYFSVALNIARLKIFTRYDLSLLEISYEDRHTAVIHLTLPIGNSLIIVATHLPSKMYQEESGQYHKIRLLRDEINKAEEKYGHSRTAVIGDLNTNPFEAGMIAADGFQAVMDKHTSKKNQRLYQSNIYRFFYNPMWSKLGDESEGPPGTYQYSSSGLFHMTWNMFDQILLRPDLLKYYDKNYAQIITQIGQELIFDGTNINRKYSDHLPIMLQLDLDK